MKFSFCMRFAFLVTLLLLPAWAFSQSVTDLTVGRSHFCALDDAGIVSCTTAPFSTRLLEPDNLPAFIDIAAGEAHTCGITVAGGAICWGDNDFNKLVVPEISTPLVSIASGDNHTCALDANGEAICWGLNTNLQLEPPPTDNGFAKVEGGNNHTCGIITGGDFTCWTTDSSIPTERVAGPFTDLDVSAARSCVLTVNGEISCFPVTVELSRSPYMDLAVSGTSVCGLTLNGDLDCSISRAVDSQTRSTIETISESVQFSAIESAPGRVVNFADFCGIRADDGSVMCFGTGNLPESSSSGATIAGTAVSEINLNLSALIYDQNAVELFWNRQANQFPPVLIDIFRDGVLLTTTDAMFSFFDVQQVAETESTYAIRATDGAGNTGPLSNEITVSRENREIVNSNLDEELINPRVDNGLRIENISLLRLGFSSRTGFGTIVLSWDRLNSTDVSVAGYEIRQNNNTLAFTRNNSYINNRIETNFCGVFSVRAIDNDGQVIETASAPITNGGRTCP